MEFYQDNTKLKWVILVVSIIISITSIYYTNVLVGQLKEREKQQVDLFAKALEYTLSDVDNENIFFVTDEIIFKNKSIPVIWITKDYEYQYANIDIDESVSKEKKSAILKQKVADMKESFNPIQMTYRNDFGDIENLGYVYYENSFLLTQLIAYPYIQLSVIAIFGFISYLAFNYS